MFLHMLRTSAITLTIAILAGLAGLSLVQSGRVEGSGESPDRVRLVGQGREVQAELPDGPSPLAIQELSCGASPFSVLQPLGHAFTASGDAGATEGRAETGDRGQKKEVVFRVPEVTIGFPEDESDSETQWKVGLPGAGRAMVSVSGQDFEAFPASEMSEKIRAALGDDADDMVFLFDDTGSFTTVHAENHFGADTGNSGFTVVVRKEVSPVRFQPFGIQLVQYPKKGTNNPGVVDLGAPHSRIVAAIFDEADLALLNMPGGYENSNPFAFSGFRPLDHPLVDYIRLGPSDILIKPTVLFQESERPIVEKGMLYAINGATGGNSSLNYVGRLVENGNPRGAEVDALYKSTGEIIPFPDLLQQLVDAGQLTQTEADMHSARGAYALFGKLVVDCAEVEVTPTLSKVGDELTLTWPGGLGFTSIEVWKSDDLEDWQLDATLAGDAASHTLDTEGANRKFVRLTFHCP